MNFIKLRYKLIALLADHNLRIRFLRAHTISEALQSMYGKKIEKLDIFSQDIGSFVILRKDIYEEILKGFIRSEAFNTVFNSHDTKRNNKK